MRPTSARMLLAGAVVLLALVGLAGTGLGWWSSATAPPPPPATPLAATAALTPASTLFGDPVQAVLTVVLDTRSVKLSSLRVEPSFVPYVATGSPSVQRHRSGDVEQVTYRYTIQCVTDGCLPTTTQAVVRLKPAVVTVAAAGSSRALSQKATWPALVVGSRLEKTDVTGQPRFESSATVAPPAKFGVSPGPGAAVLTIVAILLVLVAFAVIGRELLAGAARRHSAAPNAREAALALLRQAAGRPDPADRRKALELVAEVLAAEGEPSLAESTGSIAWAEAAPSAEQALAVADSAELQVSPASEPA